MIEVYIGEAASYAAAGVDIDAGDEISRTWHSATVETYSNRTDRMGQLALTANQFSSVRGFDLDFIQNQPGLILTAGVDGVGTKTELAERSQFLKYRVEVYERYRNHEGISQDVMAMCVEDLARDGVEPIGFYALYDTNTLKVDEAKEVTEQLARGMVTAAGIAQVVFMGGESAELGSRVGGYGPFNYNLGGFAIGIGHRDRILTGEKVEPGHKIVALRDKDPTKRGFRSNGMSLVRKVFEKEYGMEWHHAISSGEEPLISAALCPSDIFTPALVDMHGGYDQNREAKADIRAIVHVTGGGIPGKLQRILGVTGFGAVIEDPYEPPHAMRTVQELSMHHNELATLDDSAYQSLNMGIEMMAITPDEDLVKKVAEIHGKEAKIIGEIVPKSGIKLKSRGVTNEGQWIHFIPRA